jgi:NIMA (never in mitosis gene a)-related kinase 1/4/5
MHSEKDLAWHIEQRRKTGQHFSEYLVTNWVLQLLLAVGFMHSNKTVHRDIKPQNVFVDSDMNLKVGDFGVSRVLDFTAQNCLTTTGTPCYMPPEMVDSQNYSYKADIWSLGCVIYEICALEKLFPLKDEKDQPIGMLRMMDLIKHKEIKPIPQLYSEDLRKLVKYDFPYAEKC